MKKIALVVTLFLVSVQAEAQTFHRLPLAYIPYPITSWFDHNTTVGVETRYDGVNIPNYPIGGRNYFEDGHRGTDFGISTGTVVYASATGVVYNKESRCANGDASCIYGYGFGNYVALKHPDNMVSISAHLSSVSVGAIGTTVYCTSGPGGTIVGYSGNTGYSSGPHLHFELRANNLSASSPSYDPFSTTWTSRYWYDWAWVSDPIVIGSSTQYPVTTCQP